MVIQVIKTFLYNSSVHFWHMFLISSASVRFIPFLSFIIPIFAWNVPLVSLVFSKRCLVFPILFFTSTSCIVLLRRPSYPSMLFFGTLHSDGYIFPFLLCFSLFFSQLFVRPPQTTILNFFFLGCFWSPPPLQCYEPPSIVLRVLYQI